MEIVEVSITMHTNSPRDRTIAFLEAALDPQKHSSKVYRLRQFALIRHINKTTTTTTKTTTKKPLHLDGK